MESQIEIYQGSDGQTQIEVKFEEGNSVAEQKSDGSPIR